MSVIIQSQLFNYKTANAPSDLDLFKIVIELLPDEPLMIALDEHRANGRNDYPVRPTWNSIIAGIMFQVNGMCPLIRRLRTNGELRDACGFDALSGVNAVPSESAYSRFLRNVLDNIDYLTTAFDKTVAELSTLISRFGEVGAVDSKPLNSGCRKDTDADYGKKTHRSERKDGTVYEKVTSWFGYKLHAIVDALTELPIIFSVTKASEADTTNMLPLLEELKQRQPRIYEYMKYLTADRGYDSKENHEALLNEHDITPVIDIRNMWKEEKGSTRLLHPEKADNLVYDFRGDIYCQCPSKASELRPLANKGFEKKRMCRKYQCPVKAYGIECKGRHECDHYMKSIRVKIEQDMRVFCPIPRNSYKWKKLYNMRTSVERHFSRIGGGYQFTIRRLVGKKSVTLWIQLSMLIMVTLAVAFIQMGKPEYVRSLVQQIR